MVTVLEQAMGLSVDEKLQLITALCDSMGKNPDDIPIPDWQLEELQRRIKDQGRNPQPGKLG